MKGRQNSFSMLSNSAPALKPSSSLINSGYGTLSAFFRRNYAEITGSTHPGGVVNKPSKMGEDMKESFQNKEGVSKKVDTSKIQQEAVGDRHMPETIQAMADPTHIMFRDESTDAHLVSENRERARHDPQQADFGGENTAAGDAIMYRAVQEEEAQEPFMNTPRHSFANQEAKEFNKVKDEQRRSQENFQEYVNPKFRKQAEVMDQMRDKAKEDVKRGDQNNVSASAQHIQSEGSTIEKVMERERLAQQQERDKAKASGNRASAQGEESTDVWH